MPCHTYNAPWRLGWSVLRDNRISLEQAWRGHGEECFWEALGWGRAGIWPWEFKMCCRVLTSTCVRAFFTIHWGPPSSRIRNRKSLNNKIVEITICQCPREETLELDFQMLLLAFKSYFCKKKVRRVRRNSENKFCIIMWFNFSVFIVLGHYY